jgi:uncharacterized protein with HEPN domain
MDHEIKTWLFDILQSIEEIEGYFQDSPKRFEDYLADKKTQRAVERNIEIIGEAINRIKKVDPKLKIENASKIIGARNRIIHGYDRISHELIWGIIINHLPNLQTEISSLMEK